jgi:hypothetical protein
MPTFLELPLPCLPQDQTHAINAAPLVCVTICRGFRHSDQIISPNTAGQIDSGFSPRSPAGAGADAAIRPSAAIALHSLTDAGFTDINAAVVKLKKDVPDVASFARGLVFGSPLIDQVRARKGVAPDQIVDALVQKFHHEFGVDRDACPFRRSYFRQESHRDCDLSDVRSGWSSAEMMLPEWNVR